MSTHQPTQHFIYGITVKNWRRRFGNVVRFLNPQNLFCHRPHDRKVHQISFWTRTHMTTNVSLWSLYLVFSFQTCPPMVNRMQLTICTFCLWINDPPPKVSAVVLFIWIGMAFILYVCEQSRDGSALLDIVMSFFHRKNLQFLNPSFHRVAKDIDTLEKEKHWWFKYNFSLQTINIH